MVGCAAGRRPRAPAIVIGNEFLDALPAHQYVRTEAGWHERTVELDAGGHLQFGLGAPGRCRIAALLPRAFQTHCHPTIAEVAQYPVAAWLEARAARAPTAALFIDYGHTARRSATRWKPRAGTGRSIPSRSPGEADLTMHVDFAALAAAAGRSALSPATAPRRRPNSWARLGIAERASRLMSANPAQATAIETGVSG